MDAAVALQRKKTLKFLCIVDFPLSKQGIFFVTLKHKTVMKRCHSLFLLYRRKSAISPTNFRHGYSVVQPFSGGFPTLMPTISAAFWNSAGEETIF